MEEIGNIENQIYDIPVECGENFQVKFTFDLVPSDMKWASFFSGELPPTLPCPRLVDNDFLTPG